MREEIEDVLKEFKVDLVLTGHYHEYHRSCDGLYREECDAGGPIHITVGTAGGILDSGVELNEGWSSQFLRGVFGYGRITVANASALHFQFVRAGPPEDAEAGQVLDDVWIVRDRE